MKKLWNWIKWHLLIWRHFGLYKEWKGRKSGKNYADFRRGCGYYFHVGLIGVNPVEKNTCVAMKMKSGKVGLFKLIGYERYSDPDDMIKWSDWMFLGYEGEKLIKDMTFPEFVSFGYGMETGV